MSSLDALLKPKWGAEQWISEGWQALSMDEQAVVSARLDTMFSSGLPFKLKHDRMLYIKAFSLLAQLEVLAIQVPLKFEVMMPTPELKHRMRTQLLDEVFHGMVFTRILYELIVPYAMPPAYDKAVESLCNFIRDETCPKTAVVLLNLVSEALIEEIFRAFYQADVAPAVFSVILEDEHRHVCEAELYREIGLPTREVLKHKLSLLEDKLITSLFFNYANMSTFMGLLGLSGLDALFVAVNQKHQAQLETIKLEPGKIWQFGVQIKQLLFKTFESYFKSNVLVEMSPTRQLLMTQWKAPSDPTMVAEFDMNITRLDFFGKKYPPETLTILMLQAVSQAVSKNGLYRRYLSNQCLYQSEATYVALVVKLPGCGDQLGTIVFKACHDESFSVVAEKVKKNLQLMVFCYQKRLELEQKNPVLVELMHEAMQEISTGVYPYPMPANPMISLSNNGFAGYARAKSPLRVNEALKLTLLGVQKKPVWHHEKQAFLPEDCLPVSVSADHRIFNGDIPVPKYLTEAFHEVFDKMLEGSQKAPQKTKAVDARYMIRLLDEIINRLPDKVSYKLLVSLQTVWPDFVDFNDWVLSFSEKEIMAAL